MADALVAPFSYTCPKCGGVRGRCAATGELCDHVPKEFVGKLAPNAKCRAWNGKEKRKHYCKREAGAGTAHLDAGRCHGHGGGRIITNGRGTRQGINGRYGGLQYESIRRAYKRHIREENPLNPFPELALARALLEDWINRYEKFTDALLAWHESFTAAGRPISPERVQLLARVLDEYEAMAGEVGNGQANDLKAAREFVELLATPVDKSKPRRIQDIAAARQLIDSITEQIDKIKKQDEATHISRRDYFRVMGEMGRTVETLIGDERIPRDELGQEIKRAWLQIRIPA